MSKITVEESYDSIYVVNDGVRVAHWSHDETHEQFFRDLFSALDIEYAYEEVY